MDLSRILVIGSNPERSEDRGNGVSGRGNGVSGRGNGVSGRGIGVLGAENRRIGVVWYVLFFGKK